MQIKKCVFLIIPLVYIQLGSPQTEAVVMSIFKTFVLWRNKTTYMNMFWIDRRKRDIIGYEAIDKMLFITQKY